jgi:hypothetical protein
MSGFSIFTIQYLLGWGAVSSEENIMPRNQKSLLGTWRFTCCVLSACFLVSVSFRPGSIGAQEGGNSQRILGVAKAQELVQRSTEKTGVDLNDVVQLDIEVARVLSRTRGLLSLNGLRTMDAQIAQALTSGDSKLVLRLNGIEELSPQAASHLANAGYLELNGLHPARETLRELGKCKGTLHLPKLQSLDAETALFFAEGPWRLYLNGLTSIDVDVARALSICKGELSLDGISFLTDQAAEELSGHSGGISLGSLRKLSHVRLAQRLAESRVGVSLEQLDEISSECLESLVTTMFSLKLGLKEIGYEQAEVLARYRGRLILSRVETLSPDTVDVLLKSNFKLTCSALRKLEDVKLAERLTNDSSKMFGSPSLDSLTESVAEVIARKKMILPLYQVKEITLPVAKILASHQGHLILTGLRTMSDEQAELFAAREGTLRLSRALAISDQARASLENNKRITWSESKR